VLSPKQQLEAMGITLADMQASTPDSTDSAVKFTDVEAGPELLRILAIPRRPIPDPTSASAGELATFLTQRLAKTAAPYPGALRPTQALALKEAWSTRGLFAPIVAGGGKSGIFYFLPMILGLHERVLYICPAMMVPDIQAEWAKMRPHWHGVQITVLSYETLSSKKARTEFDADGAVVRKGLLERLAPTLVLLDEAHKCANTSAACTKRLGRFRKEHPEVVFVAATGTPFKTSIKDCAHVMGWCLGVHAPLPQDFLEREAWASYLDAKAGMGPRCGVGALLDFLTPEDRAGFDRLLPDDQRALVRAAIGRRILETPGVIGTQDARLDVGLTIEAYLPGHHRDESIDEFFADLKVFERLPDGTELADGVQFARHRTTGGLSHWNKWMPPPPEEWKHARNGWSSWCRNAIKHNRRGIDTEGWMKTAVRQGLYDDEGALAGWEEAQTLERARTGLLEPPSVSQWLSDEIVDVVREWLDEHVGLVWVNSIGLGDRLALELSIPYYRAEGRDARGRHITKHTSGSAIASVLANGTGRNLQKIWSKNLWLTPPGEQALARTHRPGQVDAEVRNWVFLGCAEHLRAFFNARQNKARFASEFGLGGEQRLSYATTIMPSMRALEAEGGARYEGKESDHDA